MKLIIRHWNNLNCRFLWVLLNSSLQTCFRLFNLFDFVSVSATLLFLSARVNSVSLLCFCDLVCLVTSGLIWVECKQLYDEGIKAYIQDMWNTLDFVTNSLYMSTYTLKFIAYFRVSDMEITHHTMNQRNCNNSLNINISKWAESVMCNPEI